MGADLLGLVEPVDPGNVVRRVRHAIAGHGGETVGTLSGVALRNAGVEPPAPLDTLASVELIDVLRCDERAPLAEVFEGHAERRRVVVDTDGHALVIQAHAADIQRRRGAGGPAPGGCRPPGRRYSSRMAWLKKSVSGLIM